MRNLLGKPAVRVALLMAVAVVATELLCRYQLDRPPSAWELSWAFFATGVGFSLLEVFVPVAGHENLRGLLSLSVARAIGGVLEEHGKPSFDWGHEISSAILWAIVYGFIGASIDIASERRRRKKAEASSAEPTS